MSALAAYAVFVVFAGLLSLWIGRQANRVADDVRARMPKID